MWVDVYMIQLLYITPSSRPSKKLMAVFLVNGSRHTVHFGARPYKDYITYYAQDPTVAQRKREQYISRHGARENWTNPTSAGTLARFILWEKPTLPQALQAYKARFRI